MKVEFKSLKEFALKRARLARKNRKHRKGYSIVKIEGLHIDTYQCCIYLKNTDSHAEAEKQAKAAIKAIRQNCGLIV